MSNKVRNVTKQLLGAEDVAFGRGTVNQTRGGAVVPVHRLDLELPVVDEAELATTDTAKYPRASIGSRSFVAVNGQYQELSHILPVLYRVGGMISAEYPYCINDDVIAKWTGAFPKTLTVEDADFSGAGWQIYTVGSSRTIVSETQPPLSYGKQGFRWYNPTVPATYIYYNDGDSGQWVEEASQGVDGALRSDLINGTANVGGTPSGKLVKVFQTKADLQAASLIEGTCKTVAYYGGWQATKEGPIGGAEYQIVSAENYRSSLGGTTPSGRGDFYLANGYIAKLVTDGEPVCITKYGASPYATASANSLSIQECWNNEKACSMPAMKFVFDSQLVYPNRNFWTFEGVNEFSVLEYTGPDADWAIRSPITGDGQGGVYDLMFKRFTLKGPNGTSTKKLFDCIFTRYATFEDVFMQNAIICLRHASNWSNTFNRCTFAPEYGVFPPSGIQSVAIWLANIGAATNVSNSTNFNHCRIESARNGVLCEGGGRNISFTNGTVFEQNYRHIAINGIQDIRSLVVTDCYMEAAYNAPLYIYCPSLVGSMDGVTIKNTMITCGSGANCVAALAFFDGVCSTDLSVLLENNTIEFPSPANVPVNGKIIHAPQGTTNIELTYKTVFPPRFGGGVSFNLIHYSKSEIDFRTFNTNVPFKLDYANGSNGSPFTADGNQDLVMLVDNGIARVFGTAKNAANTTTTSQPVATIPVSAGPTTAEYFPYFNASTLNQYGSVAGGSISAVQMAGGTGYFDFSYVMSRSIRVIQAT